MSELVRTHRDGDVLVVEIDNPPVNALGPACPRPWPRRSTRPDRDDGVAAIVIRGAGRTFVAGADIATLEDAAWGDEAAAADLHDLLRRVEQCRTPVVMAIHGTALGGGLELAMAGHYRVADAGRPGRAAGGEPRHHAGRRRHAAAAAPRRRRPRRSTCASSGRPIAAAGCARRRHRRRDRGRGSHRVAVAFARRVAARTSHPKTSERGDRLGDAEANAPLFAAARAQAAQDPAPPGRAAEGHRRDRGRHAAAVRERLPARARALLRVRARRAGQGPDPRVLRRARGLEAPRGHDAPDPGRDPHGRDRRRRHDGAAASRWPARTPASRCS